MKKFLPVILVANLIISVIGIWFFVIKDDGQKQNAEINPVNNTAQTENNAVAEQKQNTEAANTTSKGSFISYEEYQNNNSNLTVTIKHEMAGNNLPYVHVKSIRNNGSGGLYGKTNLARVRKLPEYNRLGEIYSAIGKLFRTSIGRSYTPEQIMQQLDKEGLFNRMTNPDTVLID